MERGEVIALFSDVVNPWDGTVTSYMHIGQHSAADYAGVVASTRPVQPNDYRHLLAELKALGYTDLHVVQRSKPSSNQKTKFYAIKKRTTGLVGRPDT